MQQLMQVATQPSPVKAVFSHDDVELAAIALLQHLIASSSVDIGRPANSPCPSQVADENEDDDDVEPIRSSYSDTVPAPGPPPSAAAAAAVSEAAAVEELIAVANDDIVKQAATSRTQRRHRTLAVRPTLPVVSQLMEMGFARRKAESAVKHLGISILLDLSSNILAFHVVVAWHLQI